MKTIKNAELMGILDKQCGIAERLFGSINDAMAEDVPKLGRTGNAAVMIAGLLESYYTCLETAFMKISQYFENNLDAARWHVDLLNKMALKIEGVRIPAVSETAFGPLLELQKFRHFKRYYFSLEYDWDRIDFLLLKLREVHPIIKKDLARFREFLVQLGCELT